MIDLHCHSNCSDGSDAPDILPRLAYQAGLKALALTDHDTLDGLDVFMDQQRRVSTRLIPGIELSCEFSGRELHVLGLFVNHRDALFRERVHGLGLRRQRRNAQIFQNLSNLEINIAQEDFFNGGQLSLITRAHIADMLLNAGHAATRLEAFQKYLGEEGLAYAPFEFLSPKDAFKWIREAGGLPAIAHPGRFYDGRFVWETAMADLYNMGARAIETYYTDHSETETAYFLALCDKLSMIPTGGSDYHGSCKPGCKIGVGYGSLSVPDWVIDRCQDFLFRF